MWQEGERPSRACWHSGSQGTASEGSLCQEGPVCTAYQLGLRGHTTAFLSLRAS